MKNKNLLKKDIENFPESYPIIANYWEIEEFDINQKNSNNNFNSNVQWGIPFYKNITKSIIFEIKI